MNISRRVLARYMATELASGKPRSHTVHALAAYLVVHKLTGYTDQIVSDIIVNLASMGTVEANVTTAHTLDDVLRKDLHAYIKKMEGADNVSIHEYLDPAILGGVIIETPRKRFDASVRTKLKRLRNV